MPPSVGLQRGINKWGARVIPALVVGIVGYATWVVIALLAVNNLLHPHAANSSRIGAGIGIIVIYFVLLFVTAVNYFRVIQVVVTNSGYVPKPATDPYFNPSKHVSLPEDGSGSTEKEETDPYLQTSGINPSQTTGFLDRTAVLTGRIPPPPGLEQFYLQDAYECDIDGLPRWCSRCRAWKPDRSHHCGEVGRCVHKMDHFCPWAGGLVSETNFKFFIQFCLSACILCIFILIVTAYFLAKLADLSNLARIDFIIVIALSAMFLLFTFGMAVNSLNFAFLNTTTVDNLSRRTRIYSIAVRLSDSQLSDNPGLGSRFTTISYPLSTPHSQDGLPVEKPRTFAILTSPSGANPYDLYSVFRNFRTVMGDHWYDWFLPLRYSPCYFRRLEQENMIAQYDPETGIEPGGSFYEFGPVLRRMKDDAGLRVTRTEPADEEKQ